MFIPLVYLFVSHYDEVSKTIRVLLLLFLLTYVAGFMYKLATLLIVAQQTGALRATH